MCSRRSLATLVRSWVSASSICSRGLRVSVLVPPTTEHVVPRLKGGPSWPENEVAACRRCNSERGHRGPVEWLEECLRRGWEPDEPRLVRTLGLLLAAIAREGGQRRARPYLDAQLRRMRRRTAAELPDGRLA